MGRLDDICCRFFKIPLYFLFALVAEVRCVCGVKESRKPGGCLARIRVSPTCHVLLFVFYTILILFYESVLCAFRSRCSHSDGDRYSFSPVTSVIPDLEDSSRYVRILKRYVFIIYKRLIFSCGPPERVVSQFGFRLVEFFRRAVFCFTVLKGSFYKFSSKNKKNRSVGTASFLRGGAKGMQRRDY